LTCLVGLFLALCPTSHAAPVVVGYFTDGNPTATGLAPRIAANGDIPLQILDISTANYNQFSKLMINESNNGTPSAALLGQAGNIANFVANGGLFIYHSRNVAQGIFTDASILPGGGGISLVTNFSTNIDVETPGTLVTNGPFGTINNSTLDGG